ncbi:MAG: glycosyltransferase [Planctomycetes bacterium]|nr:glycosyltransferase [Planctomycetota bacterium]
MQAVAIAPTFDSIALTVWFWITVLVALAWLKRHIDLNRGTREPILTAEQEGEPLEQLPPITVLVAAKDEETNIQRCVSGLLAQQYPILQVVAINDRSTDRTGELLDRMAEKDQRLRVVHVRELPARWFGKNHAMHLGVANADGEHFVFTDADCTFDSPHLLAAAMRFAKKNGVDFLSVLPRLEADTFWERVVQPVAGAIMVFWFSPQSVNNPQSSCAYANGAFMLLSREVYRRLGGHEPVKATLNEDMHLARRVKALRMRLCVIRGGDLYRVRMYTGFGQIWRGWSRIFYGCFGTFPRLLVSVLMLSIFSVGPYLLLATAAAASRNSAWVAACAGFAILSQQSVMWRFYRVTGNGAAWALTYPIGAAVCLGMTVNAMRRLVGATTQWRGTSYAGGATAESAPNGTGSPVER